MPTRREFMSALAAAPLAPAVLRQAVTTPLPRQAERLVVVSFDGIRVQEMFGGFDRDLFQAILEKRPVEEHPLYKAYWAETPEARRAKLMPFVWGELLARHGSIVGNQQRGSVMRLGNRHRFSYPGYAELMLGVAHDDEVKSNDNRRYPHETVLQFLRRSLHVEREKVALFGSWEVFQSISASRDGDVFVNAGLTRYDVSDELRVLGDTMTQTPPSWNSARFDYLTYRFGMAHLARHRPVVQWFAFNDTDEWSHAGNYPRLVEHLHRLDGWLRELWTWLQSEDDYRGRTALVFVTDHGRGVTRADWSRHGADVEGAQDVWAAFAVPGWTTRGERTGHPPVSQSQIAATLAAILGYDWRSVSPGAGAALGSGL
jgi:hypothetical protein